MRYCHIILSSTYMYTDNLRGSERVCVCMCERVCVCVLSCVHIHSMTRGKRCINYACVRVSVPSEKCCVLTFVPRLYVAKNCTYMYMYMYM